MNYTDKQTQDCIALSGDETRKIPKRLGQLINLQRLHVSNTQIKRIPKEVAQLINLQDLDITEKQSLFNKIITYIPISKCIVYSIGSIFLSLTGYYLFEKLK